MKNNNRGEKLNFSYKFDEVKTETSNAGKTEITVIGCHFNYINSSNVIFSEGSFNRTMSHRQNIPILKDHDDSVDKMVSRTTAFYKDEDKLIFKFLLDNEYDKELIRKYKEGIINEHSVSIYPLDFEFTISSDERIKNCSNFSDELLTEDNFFLYITEAQLVELSIVPFGADSETQVLAIQEYKEKAKNKISLAYKISSFKEDNPIPNNDLILSSNFISTLKTIKIN